MNAHDFVLSLADQLVEQGRTVEIDEEPDSIRIYARPRSLAEDAIGASAFLFVPTGRWNFVAATAYGILGEPKVGKTRRDARLVVEIWGRSAVREEVAS